MKKDLENIVSIYEHNPVITPDKVPYACTACFNPGAIKYDGKYILLPRMQDLSGRSNIGYAYSEDGINFMVGDSYALSRTSLRKDHIVAKNEAGGLEDCRITKIDGRFVLTYTTYSGKDGRKAGVGLAETFDFKNFKRLSRTGLILTPDNKDFVLLPEKIKRKYIAYHRPASTEKSMWIAYSSDLVNWGDPIEVMRPRDNWEVDGIGAGAVPIKTNEGWLHIYHGICGRVYSLGCALFDLEDPSRLISKSKIFILHPRRAYEQQGQMPNVVFTCGAILEDDGRIKIYYGGADTNICLGTAKLNDLIDVALNKRI